MVPNGPKEQSFALQQSTQASALPNDAAAFARRLLKFCTCALGNALRNGEIYISSMSAEPEFEELSSTSTAASELGLLSRRCPLCNSFEYPSIPLLLSHLRTVHSNDPRFHVTCGIDGCTVTLRSFSALYSHIYRHHPNVGIVKKRPVMTVTDTQPGTLSTDHSVSNCHVGK